MGCPQKARKVGASPPAPPFAFAGALRLFAVMTKITLALIILTTSVVAPAQATEDNFTPRLIVARHDYLEAVEVCLRRIIAASPVVGARPEHIAKSAVRTCREKDASVRETRKRVYGFPSVDNFMAGVDDAIFAFAVRLADAHIASIVQPK
jgi:hypothetical protein